MSNGSKTPKKSHASNFSFRSQMFHITLSVEDTLLTIMYNVCGEEISATVLNGKFNAGLQKSGGRKNQPTTFGGCDNLHLFIYQQNRLWVDLKSRFITKEFLPSDFCFRWLLPWNLGKIQMPTKWKNVKPPILLLRMNFNLDIFFSVWMSQKITHICHRQQITILFKHKELPAIIQ